MENYYYYYMLRDMKTFINMASLSPEIWIWRNYHDLSFDSIYVNKPQETW